MTIAQPLALKLRGDSSKAEAGPTAAAPVADPAFARRSGPMWPLLVGCLALAGLSLLFPSTPTYDPWAWILWGREITHLDLVTTGGPSWKPLPMFFTVPFSLFGDNAAPLLWVWIARAGGLLAVAMCFRVARRLVGGHAGIVAGVFAAAFLLSSFKFVRDGALGNSEALLAALVLWAFERFLDGRRDHALYLAFAAALLRPEAWPFFGLYGLWLWFRNPELRWRVAAVFAAIPVLWFGPEIWGSGEPLRASSRANNPNPGSAAFADHPGLEVARRFAEATIVPLMIGAAIGVGYAIWAFVKRRRERLTLVVAGAGAAWLLLVCGMTEGGYAGNQRYLIVTTAAVCVLGGVGYGRVFEVLVAFASRVVGNPRRALALAAGIGVVCLIAATPVIEKRIDNGNLTLDRLRYEASIWDRLKDIVPEAGGRERLLECGAVYSGPYQTQMIAFILHIHGIDVGWTTTPPPGVAFRTRTIPTGPRVVTPDDLRYRTIAANDRWGVVTVPPADGPGSRPGGCPAAHPGAPRAPRRADTPDLSSARLGG
jgi:hypothetical protein